MDDELVALVLAEGGNPAAKVGDQELLEIKDQELKRMALEMLAKDQMLETLQKALQANTQQAEELVSEAKAISRRTEDTFQSQLLEKDKQLQIMQGLLDDSNARSAASSTMQEKFAGDAPDRAFMDDFLLTVLEQKDRLADELHSLNNEYARLKARLGMAEFQKEKLQAESRAQLRRSSMERADGEDPKGGADGTGQAAAADPGTQEVVALISERDLLAERLAEANRSVKSLHLQLEQSRASSRDAARQRRKQAFRDEKTSDKRKAKAGAVAGTVVSSDQLKALLSRKGKIPSKRIERTEPRECETIWADITEQQADEIAELRSKLELARGGGAAEADPSAASGPQLEAELAALTDKLAERECLVLSQRASLESNQVELGMLRDLVASGPSDRLQADLSTTQAALDDTRSQLAVAQEATLELERALAAAVSKQQAGDADKQAAGALVAEKTQALAEAEHLMAQQRDLLAAADTLSVDIGKQHADVCKVLEREQKLRQKADAELAQTAADLQAVRIADAKLHEDLAEARSNATRCSALFAKEQTQRMALQNKLVELCGNIRVHCKVRPQGAGSGAAASDPEVRVMGKAFVEARIQGVWRQFEFDRAYLPGENGDAVFAQVSPLVSSFVDGYNVCIMAYGQTGSGKTYTMLGPSDDRGITELTGVIPRAMNELFRLLGAQAESADFAIRVSVMEVYNDYVRDLLSPKTWEKHEVTEGSGVADVPSVQQRDVSSADDVLGLVTQGMASRVERRTDMNAHSSRSHLIVCVHCTRTPRPGVGGAVTASRIHLVDLAGSENAKMAGSEGAGLLEGKAINQSLSALSGVLDALGSKGAKGAKGKHHVPYRNSRLTHLLKDSIGGDAKMLMIACTSPDVRCIAESIQTLRFGERARRVSKGPAQKKEVSKGKASLASALKLF